MPRKVDTIYAWIMTDNDGNERLCYVSTEYADVSMVDEELRYAGAPDCITNPERFKVEIRTFTVNPNTVTST